jgi:competence protein ComEC
VPPSPASLALGVGVAAGTASYLPLGGDPAAPVAAVVAVTGLLAAAATGAHSLRRPRLASSLNVATLGAALVVARLMLDIAGPAATTAGLPDAAGPASGIPTELPAGNGPWHSAVMTAHLSKGRQIATLALDGGVRCAALMPADPRLTAGDRIEWTGRVEALTDSDYDRYVAGSGLDANCAADTMAVLAHDDSLAGRLERLRQSSGDAIQLVIREPAGGLAAAILVGLRDRVDRGVAASFTAAGVSHIVAISGWNIAIVSATVAALLRRRTGRRKRSILTVAAIVAYTLFAGASASVVRAAVMALVAITAIESGRGSRVGVALAWAATVMILQEPATVADVGFVLSASATAGLIAWASPISGWLAKRFPRVPAPLRESLGVSLAAQTATLPVVLLVFGRLSLIAPAANLVAVPLVPPVMALGLVALVAGWLQVLGLPPLVCGLAALPASMLLSVLVGVVGVAAAVPGASQALPPPFNIAGAGAAAGLAVVVWRWVRRRTARQARRAVTAGPGALASGRQPRPARAARLRNRLILGAACLSVAMAASVATSAPDGRVHVIVLDVGQGDAILVEGNEGGRILVDGGPDGSVLLADLDRVIPSWDRRIDAVVLTHPHDDHVAGLVSVVRRYRVGAAYESGWPGESAEYSAWKQALAEAGIPLAGLSTGQSLRLDDVTLRVLWPDDGRSRPPSLDSTAPDNRKTNDASVVLLGEYQGRRFLLTGDVEDDVDPTLIVRGLPHVDLLKVAHHGSATASSEALLAALEPAVAIVSVGAGNSYGHPNAGTMARLRAHSSRVYRTDASGTIDVTLDRASVSVARARGGPTAAGQGPGRAPLLYDSGDVRTEPPRVHRLASLARPTQLAPAPLLRRRRDGRLAGTARTPGRAFGRSPPRGSGGPSP